MRFEATAETGAYLSKTSSAFQSRYPIANDSIYAEGKLHDDRKRFAGELHPNIN